MSNKTEVYMIVQDVFGKDYRLPVHQILAMTNEGVVIFGTPLASHKIHLSPKSHQEVNDYILNL